MTAFYKPTPGQDGQEPTPGGQPGPQGSPGGSGGRPGGLLGRANQQAQGNGQALMPPAPGPIQPPADQNKPKNSLLGFAQQAQQPMMQGQGPQGAPVPGNQQGPQTPPGGRGAPLLNQQRPGSQGPGPQGPLPPNQQGPQMPNAWGAPPVQQTPQQPGMGAPPVQQMPPQSGMGAPPAWNQQRGPMPNNAMPPQPASAVVAGAPVQPMEVVNGQLILHRTENFYVRTVYRPGYQPSVNPLRKPTGLTRQLPKVLPKPKQARRNKPPAITVFNSEKKVRSFPVPRWLEVTVVIVGLIVSLASHLYNIFNYPRYEMDEGTYMFSAWSILNGKIMPYAYGYGHPPFGWMQISAVIPLLGGFFAFGNAINTGRIIMLFYTVASALFVYLIVRRLGGSRSAGLLALVIFSLSPLSVTYQRQVLLDNIATFWVLLSLYCLVSSGSRLFRIVLSALFFGCAVLSKETVVLFLPCMIYGLWLHTTEFQRKFAMVTFIYVAVALISIWVLMAFLKGEIIPPEWLGDQHARLSFIGVFISQVQRGANEGNFLNSWNIWLNGDALLICFSIGASIFNLVRGWWNRKQLLLGLLSVSYWILLVRPNGVVLSFYFIPLIPMAALNAAFAINTIMDWIGRIVRFDLVRAILILMVVAAIIPYDIQMTFRLLNLTVTPVQTQALTWARDHIPRNAFVVINAPQYTDMHVPGGLAVGDGAVFRHAEVYQNVATDPEIYKDYLHKDWTKIDYIIADSETRIFITGNPQGKPGAKPEKDKDGKDILGQEPSLDNHILKTAFDHSVLVANFEYNPKDEPPEQWFDIKIYQVIHPQQQLAQAMPDSGKSVSSNVASTAVQQSSQASTVQAQVSFATSTTTVASDSASQQHSTSGGGGIAFNEVPGTTSKGRPVTFW